MSILFGFKEKDAIICKNRISAIRVLKIANRLGFKWWCDLPYVDDKGGVKTFMSEYEGEICYLLGKGDFCSILHAEKKGYNIISSKDFIDRYDSILKKHEDGSYYSTQELMEEFERCGGVYE